MLFCIVEGVKLFLVVVKCVVVFEVDDYNVVEGWSVIVKVCV